MEEDRLPKRSHFLWAATGTHVVNTPMKSQG